MDPVARQVVLGDAPLGPALRGLYRRVIEIELLPGRPREDGQRVVRERGERMAALPDEPQMPVGVVDRERPRPGPTLNNYVTPRQAPPMNDRAPGPDQSRGRAVKVARLLAEYGLDGLGGELEHHWTAAGGERLSLRDLADLFNRRLLRAELEAAGERPIDGEVENLHRLLTDEDVSSNARIQAENRLTRVGIDPSSLRADFVSHQAIHTYLTEVREVTLREDAPSAGTAIDSRQETILRLRNRLVAVIERSLESLREAGHLSLGSFDAIVNVTVYCNDCGRSFDLTDLFERRACDCGEGTD